MPKAYLIINQPSFCYAFKIPDEPTATTIYSNGTSKHFPNPFDEYTQSPIIRTSPIRLNPEILGKFKTRALGSSNLRTTSKNLRTASAQIFKAKNQFVDESTKKIKKSKLYCSVQWQSR